MNNNNMTEEKKINYVVALDAGGVIFSTTPDYVPDVSEDTTQTSQWIEGAQETIQKLMDQKQTIIVNSFAGKRRGADTTTSIHEKFPMIEVNVVDDKNKKWIVLAKLQQPSIMVDDRESVLITIAQEWDQAREREKKPIKEVRPKKGMHPKKSKNDLPLVGNLPLPILILFGSQKTSPLVDYHVNDWNQLELLLQNKIF
jgi:hypothetical protein